VFAAANEEEPAAESVLAVVVNLERCNSKGGEPVPA
jgi:hypothetical protein